jgi:hypothetical protein
MVNTDRSCQEAIRKGKILFYQRRDRQGAVRSAAPEKNHSLALAARDEKFQIFSDWR